MVDLSTEHDVHNPARQIADKINTATTVINDDDVLDITRQIRLMSVSQLIQAGQIPTDSDGFEMLHKNLQELDKQALQKKRILVDADANAVNANLIHSITASLKQNMGSRDVFAQGEVGRIPEPEGIAGEAQLIEGELDVGIKTQTFEDFMSTVGKEIDAKLREES